MAFRIRKTVVREVVPSAAPRSFNSAARLRRKSWSRREKYRTGVVRAPPGTITTNHTTMLVIVPYSEGARPPLGSVRQRRRPQNRNDGNCLRGSIHAGCGYVHHVLAASNGKKENRFRSTQG